MNGSSSHLCAFSVYYLEAAMVKLQSINWQPLFFLLPAFVALYCSVSGKEVKVNQSKKILDEKQKQAVLTQRSESLLPWIQAEASACFQQQHLLQDCNLEFSSAAAASKILIHGLHGLSWSLFLWFPSTTQTCFCSIWHSLYLHLHSQKQLSILLGFKHSSSWMSREKQSRARDEVSLKDICLERMNNLKLSAVAAALNDILYSLLSSADPHLDSDLDIGQVYITHSQQTTFLNLYCKYFSGIKSF